jgi:hypothetical protein
MKHVLGMAKSNLDLKGAKGPKLELDLLRLVYAVKELRQRGDQAKGYLLVMTEDIAKRTESWIQKYQAGDTVVVAVAKLSPDSQEALEIEKKNNVTGMLAGSLGNTVGSRSDAALGKRLGERALRSRIMGDEPEIQEITDKSAFPLGIHWDFYGQSEGSQD